MNPLPSFRRKSFFLIPATGTPQSEVLSLTHPRQHPGKNRSYCKHFIQRENSHQKKNVQPPPDRVASLRLTRFFSSEKKNHREDEEGAFPILFDSGIGLQTKSKRLSYYTGSRTRISNSTFPFTVGPQNPQRRPNGSRTRALKWSNHSRGIPFYLGSPPRRGHTSNVFGYGEVLAWRYTSRNFKTPLAVGFEPRKLVWNKPTVSKTCRCLFLQQERLCCFQQNLLTPNVFEGIHMVFLCNHDRNSATFVNEVPSLTRPYAVA